MKPANYLDTKIELLPFVGAIYAKRLEKLEIRLVKDLLFHIPFRYEDYSTIRIISDLRPGEAVTVKVTVLDIRNVFTKNGKRMTEATVFDETGQLKVIWFNQIYLTHAIKPNEVLLLSGKIDWFARKICMISPGYEIFKTNSIHTGRLVPIYPETNGVSSKWLRARIAGILNYHASEIKDYLPEDLRTELNLLKLQEAFNIIHFPKTLAEIEFARIRIAFDELFVLQMASQLRKKAWEEETAGNKFSNEKHQPEISNFIENLPFKLTGSQKLAVSDIIADFGKNHPMNRLLEGDVGSGKTVVGAIAMYISHLNGYQSALMAPTEILANQHFNVISKLLAPYGIKVKLLTGSSEKNIKNNSADDFNVLIGTHSLLNERAQYHNLGLIIIDEQQRFGVEQRENLRKKGFNPHLLAMTATPIPRTIALTMYGELEMSILTEMPMGVRKIKTWVVPEEKRTKAYEWIGKNGKKIFVVCPLIEESETLGTVRAVKMEYLKLKKIFKAKKVGLLHGKMTANEKERTLSEFRSNKLDLLVSTPIVEVGIDIPEANIMVIEGADRFGLSQLHQLRGRIGRVGQDAFCLLFTDITDEYAIKRLKALETTFLGPKLAEIDLALRGPGEILGFKQHGFVKFKAARFSDTELINKTREVAKKIVLNGTWERSPEMTEFIDKLTKTETVSN